MLFGKMGKVAVELGRDSGEDPAHALAAALATAEGVKNPAAAAALMKWRASPRWFSAAAVELREVVADADHPVHLVVRGLIRKGEGDIATIWRIMAEPRWASACRERLGGRLTRAEQEELRSVRHLALNPARGGEGGIGALLSGSRSTKIAWRRSVGQEDRRPRADNAGSLLPPT